MDFSFRALLVLLVYVFTPLASYANESLYALVVCDTLCDLRSATKRDLSSIKDLLQTVSEETGLNVTTHILHEGDVSTSNIQSCFQSVNGENFDVVLLYYSGHGYQNFLSNSSWPTVFFASRQESLPSEGLWDLIEQMHPRLSILILDCCNSPPESFPLAEKKFSKAVRATSLSYPGLKTLFLKTEGIVVIAGAAPGQSAIAFLDGSLFTNSFVQSLYYKALSKEASWNEVFARTVALCSPKQRPIANITTSVFTRKNKTQPKSHRRQRRAKPGAL